MTQFDELEILRGNSYKISEEIEIRQPTLNDIFQYGEMDYFGLVSVLTAVPYDFRVQLDDFGIDYETIDDFTLFMLNAQTLDMKTTSILFGDSLDLTKFENYIENETQEVCLIDPDSGAKIDKVVYAVMVDYIRRMHKTQRNNKRAGNEFTKKFLIQEERDRIKSETNKQQKSFLAPLISAMVNSDGFKYNYESVWNMKISQFLDSVSRIQKISEYHNLSTGIYTGNIDTKSISSDELNWLGELGN